MSSSRRHSSFVGGEPAFGVERGHASTGGSGDGLSIGRVGDVACCEDPLDERARACKSIGFGWSIEHDLAGGWIGCYLTFEERDIGGVTDRKKQPGHFQSANAACH